MRFLWPGLKESGKPGPFAGYLNLGIPIRPNPGSADQRVRTNIDPGLAKNITMGEPVTKQEVRQELGEQRPFYLLRKDV